MIKKLQNNAVPTSRVAMLTPAELASVASGGPGSAKIRETVVADLADGYPGTKIRETLVGD